MSVNPPSGFAIPKKALPPVPKPAAKGATGTPSGLATPLDKIAAELAFALNQTAEFMQRYAKNLDRIECEKPLTVREGFYKTISISAKAMQECVLPLLQEHPEINLADFTFCTIQPDALVDFFYASSRHNVHRLMISRSLNSAERSAFRSNLSALAKRCAPVNPNFGFILYVFNPNQGCPPEFQKTYDKVKPQKGTGKLFAIFRDETYQLVPTEVSGKSLYVKMPEIVDFVPRVSLAKETKYILKRDIEDRCQDINQRPPLRPLP